MRVYCIAGWRLKPKEKVLVHSDEGSQFASMDEWASFLRRHNLVHPMPGAIYISTRHGEHAEFRQDKNVAV